MTSRVFSGTRRLLVLLAAMTVGHPSVGAGEPTSATWPQWRGPTRDGRVSGGAWPERLDADSLQRLWRVPLGPSYSGPIVAEDRVFVTETVDRNSEVVRALDRATGKEIWRTEWPGSLSVPFFAKANGDWIRATPAYDGESLFVAGMRDVLVCLDADTGARRWRVDFPTEFGSALPSFGFVCSPLVTGDAVYVQAGAAFVKVDTRTGTVVWRTLQDSGGMSGSAFSSPIEASIAGEAQLLVQTRTALASVEPETGTVLWSRVVPAFRGMNILTPSVVGDTVFTSSYGGGSFLFRVARSGNGFRVDELWKGKTQAYMSTPVVLDGFAFLHLRNQRFTCIDMKTGQSTWTTRPYGKYWSLVAQGDRILALDERGELRLIRANPRKFELLGELKVSDSSTWAHLAVAGDRIFIRDLGAITAYGTIRK